MAVLLAVSLILFGQPVSGSSGSVAHLGAFTTGAAHDTGSREWVELTASGDLLTGRPKHKAIALITVYAPGCEGGHLILRELQRPDGGRSLLLSAPASLLSKTRRATIYVKYPSKNLVLLEYVEGNWKQRRPQPFRVAAENSPGGLQSDLLAFSVEGLGFYWLVEDKELDVSMTSLLSPNPSASQLLGGGFSRGLLSFA